ncbi:MAG: polysaccharide deacetylase family protein [Clostridiales bacterium]|nr:polysaccharide deacetylase family protein [Clostridiales bacterium]
MEKIKWNGKNKAVTFSYDDGVKQDARLIGLFDKYSLRSTFNINSGLLSRDGSLIREGVRVDHSKWTPEEVREVYKGHEVAVHTLTHPNLCDLSREDVIREVDGDRVRLSEIVGRDVVGMAYPGGGVNCNQSVADTVRTETPLKYARTTIATNDFEIQDDLFLFKPTVHHANFGDLFELLKKFVDLKTDEPKLFYIWGHSYEFDIDDSWGLFEDFLKGISLRDDIFYGTNAEVFGLV